MIIFDSQICTDFEAGSSREWLETNGLGGFASGTISGANTRRYHGIFTPATQPPLGRITMVSKVEETLIVDDLRYELSANQYPNEVHPRGFEFLTSFKLDPFPVWTFVIDDVEIVKRIFMVHGQNTVVGRWVVRDRRRHSRRPISFETRPLLSFVDYHHLRHEDPAFDTSSKEDSARIEVQPIADMPPVFFYHDGTRVECTGHWYQDFEYAIELERGFDHREDLFQPFAIVFDDARSANLIISTEQLDAPDPESFEKAERRRRRVIVEQSGTKSDLGKQLALAADQFIVARGSGHTIIAGYPWFSDWGRDTMIALNGLTLSTGRPDIARGILLEFSNHISQGMIPNRFPDVGSEAEYNTVDATLWFIEAIRAYAAATGDHEFVRDHLYEKLADIIAWHLRGTRYNIHVDTDGLLYAGEPGTQLTWMDAKIGDQVITPRTGKPVEIQALWYNTLCVMSELAERFGDNDDRARYMAMADLAKLSFNALFWNDAEECLYDVVANGDRDGSIRPNQIFSVSLPFPILEKDRWSKVVNKVGVELVTPVGLRSLSSKDPKYVHTYIGSPFDRDSAYHQGTVWAWLIGPFVDAYRKVYPGSKAQYETILAGFESHLSEAGVGQISEIFDADPPHRPRGCPAQAWSVAEVLRILMNDGR